jgi:hypothetical protein
MDRATVCARDPSLRLKNGYAQDDADRNGNGRLNLRRHSAWAAAESFGTQHFAGSFVNNDLTGCSI